MKKYTRTSGFSLLEILVTTGIILVLTSVGVVSYVGANTKSRDSRRVSDLQQIRTALEMYRSDYGYYPGLNGGNWTSATNLATGGLSPTYIPSVSSDPKSTAQGDYQFRSLNGAGTPTRYYGYCICANFEGTSSTNECAGIAGINIPSNYDYCQKNP